MGRPFSTLLLYALVLFALGGSPVFADDTSLGEPLRMADAQSVLERGLQVRVNGKSAGGLLIRLGQMSHGGVLLETDHRARGSLGSGGTRGEIEARDYSLEYYDGNGRLRWIRSRKVSPGRWSTSSALFSDTHVDVESASSGNTGVKKRLKLPADHATDYQIFKSLLTKFRRGERAHAAYQKFEDGRFEPAELSIVERTRIEHAGVVYEGYVLGGGEDNHVVLDEHGMPMSMSAPPLKGVWVDGSPFNGAALEFISRVPVEGVAPMSRHLELVEIAVLFDSAPPRRHAVFLDNHYQRVARDGDVYRLTLLSTRPPQDAPELKLPIVAGGDSIRRYLASTPLSQSDHPSIVARARQIVGDVTDARQATKHIVSWVHEALAKRPGIDGGVTALDVLQSRAGNCRGHTALTVALCRAAGIPARSVFGVEYLVSYQGEPSAGWHAWAEVWLEGWVGVDATIPEIGTAARYIVVSNENASDAELFKQQALILAGQPRLRIEAYKHAGGERIVIEHDATGTRSGGHAGSSWAFAFALLGVALFAICAVRLRASRRDNRLHREEALGRLRRTRE